LNVARLLPKALDELPVTKGPERHRREWPNFHELSRPNHLAGRAQHHFPGQYLLPNPATRPSIPKHSYGRNQPMALSEKTYETRAPIKNKGKVGLLRFENE